MGISNQNANKAAALRVRAALLILLFLSSVASAYAGKLSEVPLPEVPSDLRTPQARADYIVEHFWTSADSLGAYSRQALEQAFSDFLSVLPIASDHARANAFKALVAKSAPADFAEIAEIADIYLYSTDSPFESEDFYILFLTAAVESAEVSDTDKIRPQWMLESALKNRPGDEASDFSFVVRDGRRTSLHAEIVPDSETILIFYDPDCSHCRKAMKKIASAPGLAGKKVVAVYSGDDRELWEKTASRLPTEWVVGYDDGSLQEEDIYIIRTLPAIYIIAPDSTVIEKNSRRFAD